MQLTWYWKSCCLFSYYCCHNHACFHINPSEECGRCWFSCCLEVAEVRLHYWHFARLFWMVACSTRLVGYACWTPTSGCVSSCSALSCRVGRAGAVILLLALLVVDLLHLRHVPHLCMRCSPQSLLSQSMGHSKLLVAWLSNRHRSCTILLLMLA